MGTLGGGLRGLPVKLFGLDSADLPSSTFTSPPLVGGVAGAGLLGALRVGRCLLPTGVREVVTVAILSLSEGVGSASDTLLGFVIISSDAGREWCSLELSVAAPNTVNPLLFVVMSRCSPPAPEGLIRPRVIVFDPGGGGGGAGPLGLRLKLAVFRCFTSGESCFKEDEGIAAGCSKCGGSDGGDGSSGCWWWWWWW